MGSRKKKSRNNYQPVKKATQADANKQLNSLLGTQLGFVGTVLDNLVPRAETWVEGRPGLRNFRKKTNQFKDDLDESIQNSPMLGLLSQFDEIMGIDRSKEGQDTNGAMSNFGLTPEQQAQIAKYAQPDQSYDYTSPYNINNDMRNRFNR